MSTPVVVQGTAVSAPPQTSAAQPTNSNSDQNWTKGEKQATKCRDPIFALLLYGNIIAIAVVAGVYGPDAFDENTNSGSDYSSYIGVTLICGAFALGLSGLMILVMMAIPETLIKVALVFVVALSGATAAIAFASGNVAMGIFGLIFFAIGICYACVVWKRIPFAAANLVTSTTAIKANGGVIFISYFFVALAFGWSVVWAIALMGTWEASYSCEDDANNPNVQQCDVNYGVLFAMFLSYFFTHQVIQNTVHVTVSGVVGSWWFAPEESGCCSTAVCGSMTRSMTTSFGSICFGSLLVAIVQALRAIANQAQQEGDAQIIACIAACILGCLESILRYFNKWAFVYVGLYGYSYIEAGKNVLTLFKNRGWDAVIADDLVGNCLFLVSIVVGGITGGIGLILRETGFIDDDAPGNSATTAFVLGLIVGLVLCSIMMSSIASGVNATIVLFAEAPAEFEANYPELSRKMREAYSNAFPGSV